VRVEGRVVPVEELEEARVDKVEQVDGGWDQGRLGRNQSLASRHIQGQVPGSLSYAQDKSRRDSSSSSIRRTTRYKVYTSCCVEKKESRNRQEESSPYIGNSTSTRTKLDN